MAPNAAYQNQAQKREDVEGYNIPNVIRDGININAPGYTIHEPANGQGGSAVIKGTTYYPKPTARDSGIKTIGDSHGIETIVVEGKTLALPTQTVNAGFKGKLPGAVIGDKTITFPVVTASAKPKRDGIDINLPNYTVKDGSAVISGTTFYPKATARDGINIGLPNYTIKDGSAVISGTTYNYPKPTARSPDGININVPGHTIKEPANGKGGSAVIKGSTYYQARATPAPVRRQDPPTTTWANGIETIIYDGQTIALPNVTITGTNTPTSLPAATIGDQTFTFPTVTADPNAPAPTLSLSSVSGIPLPPSVTAYTPLSPITPLSDPVATTSVSSAVVPEVTTLSLSSVSGIPLPPTTATVPNLPARSVEPIFKSIIPGITTAAAAAATAVHPLAERYFSAGPDGVHTGDGSGSDDIISTDNWDNLSTAQKTVIIVVSAVVGVLLIGGITALVLCCRRRSARKYESNRYAAEEGQWKEGGYGYSQPRPPQQAQQNPFADPRR